MYVVYMLQGTACARQNILGAVCAAFADYPHSGSDWPNSRVTLERVFRGVPQDLVHRMLHANCVELYDLDVPERLPGR